MSYDDDAEPSSSSSDYFENPNKAKREALLQSVRKQKISIDTTKAGAQDLKALKLNVLRAQMQSQEDHQKKQEGNMQKPMAAGTKTREEAIKAETETAGEKATPDTIIANANRQNVAMQETRREEISNEGGA